MDLLGEFIFAVGSVICHQRPERSFFFDGHQLPVCARCTGLYVGAAAGLVAWLFWRRLGPAASVPGTNYALVVDPKVARRAIVIAAIPTAISLFTGAIGVWDGSNLTRALLAIPLGASAGAIVAAVAAKDLR